MITTVRDGVVLRHDKIASHSKDMLDFLRTVMQGPTLLAIQMPFWSPGSLRDTTEIRSVMLQTETGMRWVAAAEIERCSVIRTAVRHWQRDLIAAGLAREGTEPGERRFLAREAAVSLSGGTPPPDSAHSTCIAYWAMRTDIHGRGENLQQVAAA